MINCKDLTIVIPVKIDSSDRLDNLKVVLKYLNTNFRTNIIVGEHSKKPTLKNLGYNYNYVHFDNPTGTFHKTKTLNSLYELVDTPYVAAWDSDVLVDPRNVLDAVSNLRSDKMQFVYPFDNRIYDVPRKFISKLIESGDINDISDKDCKDRHIELITGCLFIFNKQRLSELGMENEKFIGWGGEDDERYERILKLGGNISYLVDRGPVYHIRHFRGVDSRPTEGLDYVQENREELVKTREMSYKELRAYVDGGRKDECTTKDVVLKPTIEKPKPVCKKCLSMHIIIRQGFVLSEDINRMYDKLKSKVRKPFKFICITNNPTGLNDDIGILSDSFSNSSSVNVRTIYSLFRNYGNTNLVCVYIKPTFNKYELINGDKLVNDGETFFKFRGNQLDDVCELLTEVNNIFVYMKSYLSGNYMIDDSSIKTGDTNMWEGGMDPLEMKDKLNIVGPGFCLAKWEQVTLHLHNGTTHSCYHPMVHKIPLKEVKRNCTAIHNTKFKKQQRKAMLEGKRPDECSFCWNLEDNSNKYSDRHYKSGVLFSKNFDKIKNSNWKDDYNPSYVEVSFSNKCNLACGYCGPLTSSRYLKEVQKYGPYKVFYRGVELGHHDLDTNKNKIYDKSEVNPYVDAFWEWLPELYKTLTNLRITGGEPLIVEDTYKMLDYALQHPKDDLELSVNSNMSIPKVYFDKFVTYLDKMKGTPLYKNFVLYTSCESVGKKAEYIRFGLDFNRFVSNVEYVLDNFDIKVSFMSTYNVLSISSFNDFIKLVVEWKKKYGRDRIYVDTPYLELPSFMGPRIMDETYLKEHLQSHLSLMERSDCFGESELNRIRQIIDYANKKNDSMGDFDLVNSRMSLISFFKEYDKRKNLDISKVFPEYIEFFEEWSKYTFNTRNY